MFQSSEFEILICTAGDRNGHRILKPRNTFPLAARWTDFWESAGWCGTSSRARRALTLCGTSDAQSYVLFMAEAPRARALSAAFDRYASPNRQISVTADPSAVARRRYASTPAPTDLGASRHFCESSHDAEFNRVTEQVRRGMKAAMSSRIRSGPAHSHEAVGQESSPPHWTTCPQ